MKIIFSFLIVLNAFSMGEKSFEYKRPIDRATKPYESSSKVYDKKLDRLKLGISKDIRDLTIFKAHIFEAEDWTELDKDYIIYRAKRLPLAELKEIYPQVDGFKLKRLIEFSRTL